VSQIVSTKPIFFPFELAVAHELGHALVAESMGYGVDRILFPPVQDHAGTLMIDITREVGIQLLERWAPEGQAARDMIPERRTAANVKRLHSEPRSPRYGMSCDCQSSGTRPAGPGVG
jgi:hypothetical protein